MQCGELVTLSSAGRKMMHNSEVVGLYGMIVRIEDRGNHPYKIHWYGTTKRLTSGDEPHQLPMKRYEIKRYRGTVCI